MNSFSWKNCETCEFGAKFENFFKTRFCVIRNTRFTARTLENVFYERKAQNSRKKVQNLNFLSNLKIFTMKTLKTLFHEKIVKTLKVVQNLKFWSNHWNIYKTRFCVLRKTYFTTKTLTNIFHEKRRKTVAKQLKNWSFSQISKSALKLDV